MAERVAAISRHLAPSRAVRTFPGDAGGPPSTAAIAILDGDLEEAKAAAFLACPRRVVTEHARVAQRDGTWIGVRDLLWLRWATVFVPRASLASLAAELASSPLDTDRLLMRAASPVPFGEDAQQRIRLSGDESLRRPRAQGVPQQIYNCWQDIKGFSCFGCAPIAESLRLVFFDCDEGVRVEHRAQRESFPGTVHGAVLATLADETAYFAFCKASGVAMAVTKSLSVEYLRPLKAGAFVSAKAICKEPRGEVAVELSNESGQLCGRAAVSYVVPKEQKMPGVDVSKIRLF